MRNHAKLQGILAGFLVVALVFLCAAAPLFAADKKPAAKPASRAGVGLQVVPNATGELVVLGVIPQSPAQKAGLLPGDLVIAVDGAKLRGSRFDDVARKYLWGKAGSKVTVTYLRPGVAGEKTAQLTRTVLANDAGQNLELRMLEPEQLEGGARK